MPPDDLFYIAANHPGGGAEFPDEKVLLTDSLLVDLNLDMTRRIRHCVECPRCHTRYLIGASPYANGAYLVNSSGHTEAHTLYCPCGKSALTSRWNEARTYVVSNPAYDRGYGTPDEVFAIANDQNEYPT